MSRVPQNPETERHFPRSILSSSFDPARDELSGLDEEELEPPMELDAEDYQDYLEDEEGEEVLQ